MDVFRRSCRICKLQHIHDEVIKEIKVEADNIDRMQELRRDEKEGGQKDRGYRTQIKQ